MNRRSGPRALRAPSGEQGLTLVEMLVVLSIIAVVASVSALTLGSAGGRSGQAEAIRLEARLQLAADQAMIEDRPLAITVLDDGYAFVEWNSESGAWRAADLPALETPHAMPRGTALRGHEAGTVLPIGAASNGRAFSLDITGDGRTWTVEFDGMTARTRGATTAETAGNAG